MSRISHLPFVLSAGLVNTVSADPSWRDMRTLTASGFRDMSRLAGGSPDMHRDITLTNKDAILRWIDGFSSQLQDLRGRIAGDDQGSEALAEFFGRAQTRALSGRLERAAKVSYFREPMLSFRAKVSVVRWGECCSEDSGERRSPNERTGQKMQSRAGTEPRPPTDPKSTERSTIPQATSNDKVVEPAYLQLGSGPDPLVQVA